MNKIKIIICCLILILVILVGYTINLKINSDVSNDLDNSININNELKDDYSKESVNKDSKKDINEKIELVKSISNSTIYFPFEKNNKQYILLGYRISSYSDFEKSNMEIQSIDNEDGNLVLSLKINEVRTSI